MCVQELLKIFDFVLLQVLGAIHRAASVDHLLDVGVELEGESQMVAKSMTGGEGPLIQLGLGLGKLGLGFGLEGTLILATPGWAARMGAKGSLEGLYS